MQKILKPVAGFRIFVFILLVQTACEAFLAQEDAYSDANKAKLQQTLAQLAETKVKLEKQEENWLAWQEELEQINHAVETEFRG